ncbi:MAG: asparagine synthase (glutamine-hydrolyzing) [Deltaproteobacteria bacterium]|nr:asparagine synthase (glutamine-hydrolyzing) [Deltaproteobacteria bacterium]
MCGILASWNHERNPNPLFEKALQSLSHRGPDDSGLYTSSCNRVQLGHRLLSIVDPDSTPQPFTNEKQDIWAVVNGEIYDGHTLRRKLTNAGYRFRTKSDSEILIHLYEEYGDSCLEQINGEFAFVLWDGRRKRLFAARDRFGIKPLYYSIHEKGIYLASESKAILMLGVQATWNLTTLMHIFTHQYPLPEQSLFTKISSIPPGHHLVFHQKKLTLTSYWQPSFTIQKKGSQEEFLYLLDKAVQRRLHAHCKRAVYLSGGIDSASILALSAQHTPQPLESYTVQFSVSDYDESILAARIAKHIGSKHHIVPVTQDDIITNLEDAVWHGECFAINGQLPAKYILSKHVQSNGVKVVLSGEGADEALLGYPHLKQDWIEHYGMEHNQHLLNQENQKTRGIFLPKSSIRKDMPTFLQAKLEFGHTLQSWMTPQAKKDIQNYNPLHIVQERFSGIQNPVYRASTMWTKLALANYILRGIGDGMEMAHSIEGRPPFLDHELFTFCTQLPISQKIHNGIEKHILRESMTSLLPDWLCKRPKHPFLAPPVHIFSTPRGNEILQDTLRSHWLDDIPFFNSKTVRAYLDNNKHRSEGPLMLILSAVLMQKNLHERGL